MIEMFEDEANEWRYRIKGLNNEIMVTSEGYTTKGNAIRGVEDLLASLHESITPIIATIPDPMSKPTDSTPE